VAYDERTNFQGLMTAIGETIAPPGALRVANNVVIRRVGAIENREGLAPKDTGYTKTGIQFRNAVPYDGATLYDSSDGWRNSAGTLLLYDHPDTSQHPLPAAPIKKRLDTFPASKSRGNLYLPNNENVVLVSDSADTAWKESGIFVSRVSLYFVDLAPTTGDPGPLLEGWRWAYRLVLKDTRPNGLIVRSRPTGAFYAFNIPGGLPSASVKFTIAVRVIAATESVEVYRGRQFPSTVQADDEMALVGEIFYDSFVPGAPVSLYEFTDNISDIDRGLALYTSPSQGGIESANDQPPAASVSETFKGCLFLGDIRGPARFIFSYQYDIRTGEATGVGERGASGNTTAGSPEITAVSPIAGIQVGSVLIASTSGFASTHVVSVVGTTVTMSGNASVTGGGLHRFSDAVQIDGNWSALTRYGSAIALSIANGGSDSGDAGLFGAYAISPARPGYAVTLVVEKWLKDEYAFTIRATHGDEMNPPIPLADAAAPSLSSQDIYPNGFVWSSTDEPEHFPPKNFALISERTSRILGVAATRDALFFFKEDGIYRLSGTREQWQIDPFDLTTFCILPSSLQRLDGRIYLLSNKGVVVVDDNGVQVISQAIADQVEKLVDDVRANFASLGYYKLSGVEGVAATVDTRNSEYILLTGSTTLDVGGKALRFSARSGSWTTLSSGAFVPDATGIAVDGGPLLLHEGGVYGSNYASVPSPPDTLRVSSDGGFPVECTVQPHGFVRMRPTGKVWTRLHAAFSKLLGPTDAWVTFTSAGIALPEPQQATEEQFAFYTDGGLARHSQGVRLNSVISQAHQRAWLLRAQINWVVALGSVSLESVGVESRDDIPSRSLTVSTSTT
jgi:hypothetical protein